MNIAPATLLSTLAIEGRRRNAPRRFAAADGQHQAPDDAERHERESQHEERADLVGAAGVDELRHQREEEQRHLGIQQVGDDALAERRPAAVRAVVRASSPGSPLARLSNARTPM